MRPSQRSIRQKLERGENAYGLPVQIPSPELVEIIGYLGYDFAWIDAEHGSLSLADLRHLIRAADAARVDALVRVPNSDITYIQRVLDMGAAAILVPHVRTLDEATMIAKAARYAPDGTRGACPFIRSVGHVSADWPADYQRADADILIFGLIEDIEGVENVEAIAAESGLDGLVFGPFDLSMSMGLKGQVGHPDVVKMHDRVVAATRSAGIEYVVASADWESGGVEFSGAHIIATAGDRELIVGAFRAPLERLSRTFNGEGKK